MASRKPQKIVDQADLLKEAKELLDKFKPKKPKKECDFEFNISSSGLRHYKHPYKPRFQSNLDSSKGDCLVCYKNCSII